MIDNSRRLVRIAIVWISVRFTFSHQRIDLKRRLRVRPIDRLVASFPLTHTGELSSVLHYARNRGSRSAG